MLYQIVQYLREEYNAYPKKLRSRVIVWCYEVTPQVCIRLVGRYYQSNEVRVETVAG